MREIKFRAWIPENKEFVYWNLLPMMSSYKTENNNAIFTTNIKLEFVQQYTGLKDKNGKEIYEGDILSDLTPQKEGKQTSFGTVQVLFGEYDDSEIEYGSSGIGWYVKGFYGYIRINGKSDTYPIGNNDWNPPWSLDRVLHWETIGNIYDNPELLETK